MALIEGARCGEPKLGGGTARMKIPSGRWIRWSVAVGWIAVAQHGERQGDCGGPQEMEAHGWGFIELNFILLCTELGGLVHLYTIV